MPNLVSGIFLSILDLVRACVSMDKVLDTGWSILLPGLKNEVREGWLILVLLIFWDGEIGLCPLPSAAVRCGSVHSASIIRVCLHSENDKQAGRLMSEAPESVGRLLAVVGSWALPTEDGGKRAARQSGRELRGKP